MSRRALLAGAAVAAGPAAMTAAQLLSPGGATAAEDEQATMFVGEVAEEPSARAVECRALGDDDVVEVRPSGGRALSEFGVGDTVVAVDVSVPPGREGTLTARGVIPCVIGQFSDVVR